MLTDSKIFLGQEYQNINSFMHISSEGSIRFKEAENMTVIASNFGFHSDLIVEVGIISLISTEIFKLSIS